ncbi:effector protein PevD1 [Colletotrichum liriopes]|uniref:Effector protein PevD1 n=1 Tax=Colletotrichum liriopes TaxID=708192 RepID=A0AA37LT62_9PEZI|nr:effector protein PevD1 [Colletotrichum liriopes]
MQLILATVAALLGSSALAVPAPQATDRPKSPSETIEISNFSVRQLQNGTITNVNFSFISSEDDKALDCEGINPGFPSTVITCGQSYYRFKLGNGIKTRFSLSFFHQLAPGFGFWGYNDIPVSCDDKGSDAEGLGASTCTQIDPPTVIIIEVSPPLINF